MKVEEFSIKLEEAYNRGYKAGYSEGHFKAKCDSIDKMFELMTEND